MNTNKKDSDSDPAPREPSPVLYSLRSAAPASKEALLSDQRALEAICRAILADERLAAQIVSAWAAQHNYYLIKQSDYPRPGQCAPLFAKTG